MWQALTPNTLLAGINPAELVNMQKAENTAAPSNPQAWEDVVAELLRDISAEVRLHIASGGRARLSDDPTLLPPGLHRAAAALARFALLSRYGIAMSEPRKAEYDTALALMAELRSGKFLIDDLNTPTPQTKEPRARVRARKSKNFGINSGGIM